MRKLLLLVSLVAALSAHGRTVSWNDMHVRARLDANGRLTARETLTFVFDGDWNGGERTFRTSGRQQLSVERVTRIENGTEIPLTGGNLDEVDHYEMVDDSLRWRSRLPSDPPFDNKVITYAIDYTMDNILVSDGAGHFTLNHDFAFPEREGLIRNFTLDLEIDPAWSGATSPYHVARQTLPPGEGMIVTLHLTRSAGAPAPASVWMPPPASTRYALAAGFAAAIALLCFFFYSADQRGGRFEPLVPLESIDRSWLDAHVFSQRPEVIGAAWDDDVGAPEVAAVLARLTAEGKLESRVEGKTLHLKLLAPRSEFREGDRSLIRALFFDGDETDTDAIRTHYASRGFDPAKEIRDDIETELKRLPEWKTKVKRVPWLVDLALLAASIAFMIYVADSGHPTENDLLVRTAFLSVIFGVAAIIAAAIQSHSVSRFRRSFFWVALPLVPVVWPVISSMLGSEYGLMPLLAAASMPLAIVNFVLHVLRIPESPVRIAYRKRLASARRYFERQLRSNKPALDDTWLPWILAFGLGRNVDRWFKSYSSASDDSRFGHSVSSGSTSSISSSSSGSTSWTGGGGAFGGAGATGSWALAAGAMASGVSAPSSSSSGGGSSSSSSSSSGGGGGGGW